jgi:hypothetical protein
MPPKPSSIIDRNKEKIRAPDPIGFLMQNISVFVLPVQKRRCKSELAVLAFCNNHLSPFRSNYIGSSLILGVSVSLNELKPAEKIFNFVLQSRQ